MDPNVIRERVMKSFFSSNKAQLARSATFREVFLGFVHAVNWKEPLIATGVASYLCLWIVVIITRKNWNAQFGLFGAICAAVWAAPHINAAMRRDDNWREVGFTQNYFDERGVFISAMYSGPLLLVVLAQMLYAFFSAASLLVKVKRKQIEQQRRRQGGRGNNSGGGDVNASPMSISSDPANPASSSTNSGTDEEPKNLLRRRGGGNKGSSGENNSSAPDASAAGTGAEEEPTAGANSNRSTRSSRDGKRSK